MNASCQCGSVSFKTPLPKPLAVYICYCDECRKQSSSAFGCSAIFPAFPLPCKDALSCYTRSTASGNSLNCYFCKSCGTRILHSTPGKDVVSVKGGCIDGLDWGSARHIWCKRAVVPIPEGVERDEEEPIDEPVNEGSVSSSSIRGGASGGSVLRGFNDYADTIGMGKGKERGGSQLGVSSRGSAALRKKHSETNLRG